jgi:hypothetical protein
LVHHQAAADPDTVLFPRAEVETTCRPGAVLGAEANESRNTWRQGRRAFFRAFLKFGFTSLVMFYLIFRMEKP